MRSPTCSRFVWLVAAAMGDVDIAFIVGLLASGVVYVLLTRSLDVSHELAMTESHPGALTRA